MSFSSVLGTICLVLGLSFVWPQVFRIYRVRSVEGISPRGQLHAISGSWFWVVYGYARLNVPMMVSNTVYLCATVFVTVLLIRHRKMPAWHLMAVVGVFMAIALATAFINPAITAWIGIGIGTTSIIPQAVYALRYANLSGVSMGMYGLLTISCCAWMLYGFVIGDLLMSAPNFIVIPCALLIAGKAWRYQRAKARAAAAGPTDGDAAELATA